MGLQEYYKEDHYVILKIGEGGIPITLEKGQPVTNENSTYPIFFSSNLEDTYKGLTEKGVKVSDIQKDGLNSFFTFYDLDGNKLQVCFWE